MRSPPPGPGPGTNPAGHSSAHDPGRGRGGGRWLQDAGRLKLRLAPKPSRLPARLAGAHASPGGSRLPGSPALQDSRGLCPSRPQLRVTGVACHWPLSSFPTHPSWNSTPPAPTLLASCGQNIQERLKHWPPLPLTGDRGFLDGQGGGAALFRTAPALGVRARLPGGAGAPLSRDR